jgi:hypothetical protein
MPRLIPYIIILFCLGQAERGYTQSSTAGNRITKVRYNTSKNAVSSKSIVAAFENSSFPHHGLGLKVGDPFSISYKFYPNKKFGFTLDVGKAASGLYSRYFREQFANYAATDTFSNIDASMQYLSHRVKADLVGEFKLMYHVDARKVSPGLQVYIGAGWQWKTTHLRYDYLYNNGDLNPSEPGTFGQFERHRFTMGPQIVTGIEYAYFQIPISAFMEVEYFTDILVDPGWKRFEGGIGLRYIF